MAQDTLLGFPAHTLPYRCWKFPTLSTVSIFLGCSIGVFLGSCVYRYWDFKAHPGFYAMQSAPWYVHLEVQGLCTAALAAILLASMGHIRKNMDKKR